MYVKFWKRFFDIVLSVIGLIIPLSLCLLCSPLQDSLQDKEQSYLTFKRLDSLILVNILCSFSLYIIQNTYLHRYF